MIPYANHPEFVPEWDVYRDPDGNAVTYGRVADGPLDWKYWTCHGCDDPTAEQLTAVRHAVSVWRLVCAAESSPQATGVVSWFHPNMAKSRLLHRLIHLGLPPTRTKPPLEVAGPAWWLLPGGDPFLGDQ